MWILNLLLSCTIGILCGHASKDDMCHITIKCVEDYLSKCRCNKLLDPMQYDNVTDVGIHTLECHGFTTASICVDDSDLYDRNGGFYVKSISIVNGNIPIVRHNILPQNRNVSVLDLSENGISSITPGSFEPFKSLKKLILVGNKISTLSNGALTGLENLTELDLSRNRITELGSNELSDLLMIERLYLSRNQISLIEHHALGSFSYLAILDLSYNKLTHLDSSVFHGKFSNLRELYLEGNDFTATPALNSLTSLERLYFGQDAIVEIEAGAFTGLTMLKALTINGGSLKKVGSLAFDGLVHLKHLNLANNEIDYVDVDAFGSLKQSLRSIDLSNNNIRYLNKSMLDTWDDVVESIRIEKNPFHCDCHLKWMVGLDNLVSDGVDAPRCSSPHNLADMSPVYLTKADLICSDVKLVSKSHYELWVLAAVAVVLLGATVAACLTQFRPRAYCCFGRRVSRYAYHNLVEAKNDGFGSNEWEASNPVPV